MKKTIHLSMTALGGCALAALLWLILAMPGFVSERDTLIHAVGPSQMATR